MAFDNYNAISERMPDGTVRYTVSCNLKSENDIFWHDRNTDSIIIKENDGISYILHIGLFIIKVPYEFVLKKKVQYGEGIWYEIERNIIDCILNDYYENNESFRSFLEQKNYDIKEIKEKINNTKDSSADVSELFCHYYYDITEYFDTWAVLKTNDDFSEIRSIILKQKSKEHNETVNW